jgi:dephospho-CoA kinase
MEFKDFISEGVNDPAIFKAVFLAGGPGSGKSFVVGNTALQAQGLKLINSDNFFETLLAREAMTPTPENIYSPRGQQIRNTAKALTALQQKIAVKGRLGLVIDGTGKNLAKIKTQNEKLKSLGYDTAIVFVNTDKETAIERNRKRPRQLPDEKVTMMWKGVQNNMGAFQQIFKENMFIVDNSDNVNTEANMLQAYRNVKRFVDSPIQSHIAKKWISDQKSSRNRMNEKLDASDSMGKWIDDFQKSDAPQFKGKNKKKRRQMAVAAKLDAMDEKTEVRQDNDIAKRKGSQPAKYHAGLSKSTKQKRDAQFKRQSKMSDSNPKAYKPAPGDATAKTKPSKYTKFVQRMMDEEGFEPHMMYHPKTGKGIMAKRYADHVRLDKLGYVHDKKDVKEKVEDVLVDPKTKKDPMALPKIGKLRNVQKRVSKQRVKDTKVFDKIKIDENELPRSTSLDEVSMSDIVKSKTIYKDKYAQMAKSVLDDYKKDKKSRGGRARHDVYFYAGKLLRKFNLTNKFNTKILGKQAVDLLGEEAKYERGTPEATAYMKAMTPGEPGKTTKKNKTSSKRHYRVDEKSICEEDGIMCGEGKYYCRQRKACVDIPEGYKDRGDGYIVRESVADAIEHVNNLYAGILENLEDNGKPIVAEPMDTALTEKDIRDMMLQADNVTIDDMVDLGILEPDEVVEVEVDDEEGNYEDDIQVTEALTPLGRIKRRQAARRNKTKLKLARIRASKRAGGNTRIKMRATRGARNMMYKRLLRGRDKAGLPPAEKARLETMIKRFQPLISRIAVRLIPQVRKVELNRLKNKRGTMTSQKAKKFSVKKGGSVSKYKAKKFKIKKAKK